MNFTVDFNVLHTLKTEWDALQPLADENARRLWKKLRLEWNYHSNHLEGNTLTYGETELLLLHGQATGDHALRDYEEMKAHDVGIAHLRVLAEDCERPLTEADVRDLNRIILKEPYWKAAEALDGLPTRKQIIPGEYKTLPNIVRTATGEIFEYASPLETPPRVAELVQWLRESLADTILHPVAIAAKLHHDFVLIHPFDDGNGRVARLLVNYVLLRGGYPPIVVRSEVKTKYFTALRKADAGDLEALVRYLAGALEWSLALGIRAAKGEAIEELSDTEKEVALFVRGQRARMRQDDNPNEELIAKLFESSLKPFVAIVEAKLLTLSPLFNWKEIAVEDGLGFVTSSTEGVPFEGFRCVQPGQNARISFTFHVYQSEAPTPFDLEFQLGLHFPPGHYSITYDGEVVSYPYSKPLLGDEAEALAVKILAYAFSRIKAATGEQE